jgi:hypothetical protein
VIRQRHRHRHRLRDGDVGVEPGLVYASLQCTGG